MLNFQNLFFYEIIDDGEFSLDIKDEKSTEQFTISIKCIKKKSSNIHIFDIFDKFYESIGRLSQHTHILKINTLYNSVTNNYTFKIELCELFKDKHIINILLSNGDHLKLFMLKAEVNTPNKVSISKNEISTKTSKFNSLHISGRLENGEFIKLHDVKFRKNAPIPINIYGYTKFDPHIEREELNKILKLGNIEEES